MLGGGPMLTILRTETHPVGPLPRIPPKRSPRKSKALACAAALPQQTARLLQQSPEVGPELKNVKIRWGKQKNPWAPSHTG